MEEHQHAAVSTKIKADSNTRQIDKMDRNSIIIGVLGTVIIITFLVIQIFAG